MARIRFLTPQVYETLGPGRGPAFPAGYVLDHTDVARAIGADVTEDYAKAWLDRWVQRGQAEPVGDEVPASTETIEVVGAPPKPAFVPFGTEKHGEPTPGLDDGKQVQKTDLSKLTRAELEDMASKRGIDVTSAKTKPEIVALLEAGE